MANERRHDARVGDAERDCIRRQVGGNGRAVPQHEADFERHRFVCMGEQSPQAFQALGRGMATHRLLLARYSPMIASILPGQGEAAARPGSVALQLPGQEAYIWRAAPGILIMPVWPALAILVAIVVALTGPAAAQERRVPTGAEIKLSFAPIVQRVAPAVVNVYAAKVVENRNPLFDDPLFRRFFGSPR